jgi:hypothetical protein
MRDTQLGQELVGQFRPAPPPVFFCFVGRVRRRKTVMSAENIDRRAV